MVTFFLSLSFFANMSKKESHATCAIYAEVFGRHLIEFGEKKNGKCIYY